MKILISPAKSINFSVDIPPCDYSLPNFLDKTKILNKSLRNLSVDDLSKLMNISHKLSSLNHKRINTFDVVHDIDNSKQSIFIFDGPVYRSINAQKLNIEELDYLQKNLFIISGFYGILRPLDIIQAYRLEMGTNLRVTRYKNLYAFWENTLTNFVNQNERELIINLASSEYFKVLNKKKLNAKIITPIFKDFKNGKLKTIAFFAKKSRGNMVHFLAKNNISNVDDIKTFDYEGYSFDSELSDDNNFIFVR